MCWELDIASLIEITIEVYVLKKKAESSDLKCFSKRTMDWLIVN